MLAYTGVSIYLIYAISFYFYESFGMIIERVLVVQRKSLYQIYIKDHKERFIQNAIRQGDRTAKALLDSHHTQLIALQHLTAILKREGITPVVKWRGDRRSIANYDLIISLGGDGTLLDTAQFIFDKTPLLGINSDPERSMGALCGCTVRTLPAMIKAIRRDKISPHILGRIRVRIDGEEQLGPVLNDVLIAHASPAGLSRIDLALIQSSIAEKNLCFREHPHRIQYRCSGIWISTAAGSSGAIHSAGGVSLRPGSRRIQYLIREPYITHQTKAGSRVNGFVKSHEALILVNRMRRGMIWADGIHRCTALSYGQAVCVDRHPQNLRLISRLS